MTIPTTIGVAGLGLLGRGIAACCLAHGFRVIAYSRQEKTHTTARGYIEEAIDDLIQRAGFPASLAQEWNQRYTPVTSLDSFAPCDFVMESITENLQIKETVFDTIEAVVDGDVPIASNTSTLPITQM